jgi:hypothetical protein
MAKAKANNSRKVERRQKPISKKQKGNVKHDVVDGDELEFQKRLSKLLFDTEYGDDKFVDQSIQDALEKVAESEKQKVVEVLTGLKEEFHDSLDIQRYNMEDDIENGLSRYSKSTHVKMNPPFEFGKASSSANELGETQVNPIDLIERVVGPTSKALLGLDDALLSIMKRVDVPGNGDCFFYCLWLAIKSDDEYWSEIVNSDAWSMADLGQKPSTAKDFIISMRNFLADEFTNNEACREFVIAAISDLDTVTVFNTLVKSIVENLDYEYAAQLIRNNGKLIVRQPHMQHLISFLATSHCQSL